VCEESSRKDGNGEERNKRIDDKIVDRQRPVLKIARPMACHFRIVVHIFTIDKENDHKIENSWIKNSKQHGSVVYNHSFHPGSLDPRGMKYENISFHRGTSHQMKVTYTRSIIYPYPNAAE
jgi:hypothetical protein